MPPREHEDGAVEAGLEDDYVPLFLPGKEQYSAHQMGKEGPWRVGFHLIAAFINAAVLTYPALTMVVLGWKAGILAFAIGVLISIHNNLLLSELAVIDGVRYYRVRDVAHKVLGPPGFWITFIGQWSSIVVGNAATLLLAASALQGIYDLYAPGSDAPVLEWFILIAAIVVMVEAVLIPDLHNTGTLSGVSACCTLVIYLVCTGVALHDGCADEDSHALLGQLSKGIMPDSMVQMLMPGGEAKSCFDDGLTSPAASYSPTRGPRISDQVSSVVSALNTICFAYNMTILVELQAAIKEPPVKNFRKSLTLFYGAGVTLSLAVVMVSYWAYGSSLAPIVLANLSGPAWLVSIAWLATCIQMLICFQVWSATVYEGVDTWLAWPGGPWAFRNILTRVLFRIPYIALLAVFAAVVPYIGDFMTLIGSLCTLPINFVLNYFLHLTVNKHRMSWWKRSLYSVFISAAAVFATIATGASFRDIILDTLDYDIFII